MDWAAGHSRSRCTSHNGSIQQPRYTPNVHNQFGDTGMSYDAAGNTTADTFYAYTYDAENRITSADVSGTYYCYTYDGDGLRVEKATASSSSCSSPTVYQLYWRNIAGNAIACTDGTGSTSNSSYHEFVYFAGRMIARSDPSAGHVYYYFVDSQGNTRIVTDESGSVQFNQAYFPYGQEVYAQVFDPMFKFTGYERDPETGNDYAFARYYNPRLGRFMSVDPLPGDSTDPQTLNRYVYVRNNPANLVDPSGMVYGPSDSGGGGPDVGVGTVPGSPCAGYLDPSIEVSDALDYLDSCTPLIVLAWPTADEIWATSGGGGAGGPQGPPPPSVAKDSISKQVLADCIKTVFSDVNSNIAVQSISASSPGGYGQITVQVAGMSAAITVTNDAHTYSSAQLTTMYGQPLPPGGFITGLTSPSNPYTNLTNNNNNALGTVRSQVHEFGHSLYDILTGSPDNDSPGHGAPLDNCVNKHGGYTNG